MADLHAPDSRESAPIPPTGGMAAPPAGAPVEPAQPLNEQYFANVRAHAGNERTLEPLTYGQSAATPPPAPTPGDVRPAKEVQAAPGWDGPVPTGFKTATPRTDYPAGSDSDSPSRGLPGTAPIPAGRRTAPLPVVGGFGQAEGEYFPLTGVELKALVEQLLDEVFMQIQNDLRFHLSQTYPRLSATLTLRVEGEADDQGLTIEKIRPPVERLPKEVAQEHCDSVVFVITKRRREFDDAGEVETPPDAMRHDLGLKTPYKHLAPGPLQQAVDVDW